jgi:DNA polymerase delta subunit 1
MVKDDITPAQIFAKAKESDASRAEVAVYCIQDCNLVHHIFQKTDMLTGFIEMANLCSVPLDYLVSRGQGIKLTSYISKKCRLKQTLMPVLQVDPSGDGYEGAIVLEPKCDIYTEDPVAVLDYKSLYPSSMIAENICSSSKVWTKVYDLNGALLHETPSEYDNLPGYGYIDVTADTYTWERKTAKAKAVKVKSGIKVCRFAQYAGDRKAIFPSVLEELLQARSATRKLMAKESDEFMRNILDKRQNAYKLTANSLYGQCGARTSTFFDQDVAASCTSIGRSMLMYAKQMVETMYQNDTLATSKGDVNVTAEYVYGDTDSVFFKFAILKDGVKLKGRDALSLTIELAKGVGQLATAFIKSPHELEYEKTFFPFMLLSKKRYVGMKYEDDMSKCKRVSMGIVLKRRGNAPIVKDIYGGMIDIIMASGNIKDAITFVKDSISNLRSGKVTTEKLVITKQLRSFYKNPNSIAHKVLADRIGSRDAGNKPKGGDRISYMFVETPPQKGKKLLQGHRIETPEFVGVHQLKPDYKYYIDNQLMVPITQVLSLVKDDFPIDTSKKRTMDHYFSTVQPLSEHAMQQKRTKLQHDAIKSIFA